MYISFSYLISQILVIIYYLIYSSTFHLKSNDKILKIGIIATIIRAISYILLSAYTGMAMCIVAIIRNKLFTKKKRSIIHFITIIILTLFCSIFTFNSYFCLFNIIATLIYTYALWQKNTRLYKLLGILVNILMIIYDMYIKSIFGVILLTMSLINSILGYIKESKNC